MLFNNFVARAIFCLTSLLICNVALCAEEPLRLGLSAVMIGEQQDMLLRWKRYLETHLQRPVEFVQRRSYKDTIELFRNKKIDAGWICGAPHVQYKSLQSLMAVGIWKGRPLYQSYLIVPDKDITTRTIGDLKGKIFGYSDPDSNSGHNVPVHELMRIGANPDDFFSKTMYTYSHRKLIEAVGAGLLDGAYVDGYIYERMTSLYPEIIARTRLVQKSKDFGFPPIVASKFLSKSDFIALQNTLINMDGDAEGRALLAAMGLDRFIKSNEHLYDGVAALQNEINGTGHAQ